MRRDRPEPTTIAACTALVAVLLTLGAAHTRSAEDDGDDLLLLVPSLVAALRASEPGGLRAGPAGGRLEFANGIVLDIPPDALSEPVTISIEPIDCETVRPLLDTRAISNLDKRCLAGVEALPDGLAFAVPATLTLPIPPLGNGELPLWAIFDETGQTYEFQQTTVVSDGGERKLQVEIAHFSSQGAVGGTPQVEVTGDPLPPCCSQVPTPINCCCTSFKATSNAGDVQTGSQCDDCQIVGEEITVEFISCPGRPTQSAKFSESTSGCPQDLQLQINPPSAALWTCETGTLEATLDGTNRSGGACSFAAPVDWTVTANNSQASLTPRGVNEAEIRALQPGTATVEITSPLGAALGASSTVTFESVGGVWRESLLSGSEVCVTDGQATVENEGPSQFDIEIVHSCSATTNSVQVSPRDFPQAAPFIGNLTETGDPQRPFVFDIGVTSSQTPDCIVFTQSNGQDIVFGNAPVCPPGGPDCEAISCTETESATGAVSSARTRKLLGGTTDFTFAAAWDVLTPNPNTGGITRERRTIQCDGGTTFTADKL